MRPLILATALLSIAAPVVGLRAQATTAPTVLFASPGDHPLATLAPGVALQPGSSSGDFVRVNLRGFIATSLLGGKRDSFPVTVSATGARLRASAAASAPVVADLQSGMAFHVVKRGSAWTEVERAGWVRRTAIPAALADRARQRVAPPKRPESGASGPKASPASPSQAPSPASPASAAQSGPQRADTTPPAGALTPATAAELAPAPGVAPVATVRKGALLVPEARTRGWVRVSLDGWVRESDLVAADSSISAVSAADLQANPDQYVGKTVRWTVTALAFQTADALRKDMRTDEPYLLARGPGSESTLMYLALPPRLVDRARALRPMTEIVVMARIRTGRSDPSGVPILDVESLTQR